MGNEARARERTDKEILQHQREWTAYVVVEIAFRADCYGGGKPVIEYPGTKWAPNPVCIEIQGKDELICIPYTSILWFKIHKIPDTEAN